MNRLYRIVSGLTAFVAFMAAWGTVGVYDLRPMEFSALRLAGFLAIGTVAWGINVFFREVVKR